MKYEYLKIAIILAGLGELILVIASTIIPKCLDWKGPMATLPKLMRQLFWTYAGYVLGMHLFFGLISTFGAHLLIDGTPQALILCGLMMTWWFTRIVLQFFCFDRGGIPQTGFNTIAEALLVLLFFYLAGTYSAAVYFNLT